MRPRLAAFLAAGVALVGLALPSSTSSADKPLTVASIPPPPPRWEELEGFLAGVRGRFRGTLSYFVEDLQTGQAIVWNESQPLPAASIIKLPLAVALFEQGLAGKVQLEDEVVLKAADKADGSGVLKRARAGTKLTVASLLELMLQRSDNTATNILTNLLGLEEINASCRRQGLATTCMPRYIMDLEARDNQVENLTSAADMGRLLKALYGRRILDEASSARLLEILKGQQVRDRLPRYLPPGVVIAHKTGLMKDACHDVGIIYGRNHDYVIAVLTTQFGSFTEAKQAIGQIGRAVWQYDAGEKLTLPPAPRGRKAPPAKTRFARKAPQRRG
ncbi:MAG TPA: serine hydrolase [Candidatus Methanoperedens sp.]|nr:serine hydrolase [Candidatus Methanoperedens sp.]